MNATYSTDLTNKDTHMRVAGVTMCLCDATLYSRRCLHVSKVISASREHKGIKA